MRNSLTKEAGSDEPGVSVLVAEVEIRFLATSNTMSSGSERRKRACDVAEPYIGEEHPGPAGWQEV